VPAAQIDGYRKDASGPKAPLTCEPTVPENSSRAATGAVLYRRLYGTTGAVPADLDKRYITPDPTSVEAQAVVSGSRRGSAVMHLSPGRLQMTTEATKLR
jgi:hypothetical protein